MEDALCPEAEAVMTVKSGKFAATELAGDLPVLGVFEFL